MTDPRDILNKIAGQFDASELSMMAEHLSGLREPLALRIGELFLAGEEGGARDLADRAASVENAVEILSRLHHALEAEPAQ